MPHLSGKGRLCKPPKNYKVDVSSQSKLPETRLIRLYCVEYHPFGFITAAKMFSVIFSRLSISYMKSLGGTLDTQHWELLCIKLQIPTLAGRIWEATKSLQWMFWLWREACIMRAVVSVSDPIVVSTLPSITLDHLLHTPTMYCLISRRMTHP